MLWQSKRLCMPPEPCHTLVRRFFAELDRLRGGPAKALCAPGYTAHLAGSPPRNLAEHQAATAELYAAFPDLRHNIELLVIEDDRAAVRLKLYGSHWGQFHGVAPTGRAIVVTACVMLRFAPGGVAELWGELDEVGLLHQLSAGGEPADEGALGI